MEIVSTYSDLETMSDEGSVDPPWKVGDIYELLLCPACRVVTLRSYFWNEAYMESEADVSYRLLYPSDVRLPSGLPSKIEAAFVSALKVKKIDSNAFGVLVGRVIELVCSDRSASGTFLSHKLSDLAKRGEIPHKLVGVANGLAKLRNVGAHAELGELTPEEAPILEGLCRALLEYVYSAPVLAQQAESKISQLIKRRTEANEPE